MNNAIKYLVIPGLFALIAPFIIAGLGLIDFETAGRAEFYVMIAVGVSNAVLYKKLAKPKQQKIAN